MTTAPIPRQSPEEPRQWGALVSEAQARARPSVVAEEYVDQVAETASRPQKFRGDDGRLYAVKFRNNDHGDGRAVFTEQVVGLLGQRIGAPVPEVAGHARAGTTFRRVRAGCPAAGIPGAAL